MELITNWTRTIKNVRPTWCAHLAVINSNISNLILVFVPLAVMNPKDEVKQRSFKSSLRNSRRKTFPKFSSRQTKFQDPSKGPNLVRRTSFPVPKTGNGLFKGHERKPSLTNLFACLPIKAEFRDSGVYEDVALDTNGGEDDMQEIKLTLKRGSIPAFGSKT